MNLNLKGAITALITPFKDDLSIDFDAYKRLIDFQIESNIDGIVVCGSTGESPTLSHKEKLSIFIQAAEYSAKRIPVIAGTGSYNTADTIDMTILAKEHGCDAALVVAPYYNKPTQEGLFQHYLAVAETSNLPLIIYNIPGRSGVNILPETQLRLAEECENIIGTKEASGNLEQIMQIIKYAPENFKIFSGDDALTFPIMAAGGHGVISVLTNYLPVKMKEMTNALLKDDLALARKLHFEMQEVMQINFIETNPIPVKTVMSMLGFCEEVFRLPLLPITDAAREYLITCLIDNEIIEVDEDEE